MAFTCILHIQWRVFDQYTRDLYPGVDGYKQNVSVLYMQLRKTLNYMFRKRDGWNALAPIA